MSVVIDANIIISGLRFSGTPRTVLELANKGDLDGFTSSKAMEEIEKTLLTKFGVSIPEWIGISEVLRESFVVVPTAHLPSVPELRDQLDLHILVAAKLCEANYIISGDKDLLVLGAYKDIPIIKASEFVERYI